MKSILKKALVLLGTLLVIFLAAITIGKSFLISEIKSRLEEQIHKLRDAGYIVSYDSITLDWQENAVEVFSLSVKHDLDSALCEKTDFISAKHIKAGGFRIIPLLLRSRLSFGSIVLDSPKVVINERLIKEDSVTRKRKEFTIVVDDLKLPDLYLVIYDSKSCRTGSTYYANASVNDFKLAFYEDRPMLVDVTAFRADSIQIEIPDEYYSMRIKEVSFKPAMGIVDLDTLQIIPKLGKIAFGRQKGYETDRIEGMIPYINLYGLELNRGDSMTISARKMTTQIFLKVFRDKRLPFKRKYKNLPVAAINKLPVGIRINSVVLNKSYVEYEEFAEEADSAGSVFFDNMFATIKNINNTDISGKGETELIAKADFMGAGTVKVHAVLPWDTRIRETVTGSVENLDMKRLNRMIEPAIQVRAESGHLDKLTFEFTSNGSHAKGGIELDYKNLRLTTYKSENRIEKIVKRKKRRHQEVDEDDEKIKKASFKTFIVNTFIIRKNMNKNVPEEKRTGTIDFERDPAKSVFNFWWKSLLSGVKSAYNIEKLQDSKLTRLLRKKDRSGP